MEDDRNPLPEGAISPADPKDPILILILALFLGPVAYFVYGQWQKGLAGLLLHICLIVFAIMTCGVGAMLFPLAAVAILIDAYMQAKVLSEGKALGQWTFFTSHL